MGLSSEGIKDCHPGLWSDRPWALWPSAVSLLAKRDYPSPCTQQAWGMQRSFEWCPGQTPELFSLLCKYYQMYIKSAHRQPYSPGSRTQGSCIPTEGEEEFGQADRGCNWGLDWARGY